MSDFWAWFNAVSAEAAATESGKQFVAAGFEVWHGGGGMLAWSKSVGGDILLTIADDGNLELDPDYPDSFWTAGLLSEEDCAHDPLGDLDQPQHKTVADVLAYAQTIEEAEKLAQRIGTEFAAIIRQWLDAEEFDEMRRRNAKKSALDTSCASHDFCDANMAMAEAFARVTGREFDAKAAFEASTDTPDVKLFNRAWAFAKPQFLTARATREELGAIYVQWIGYNPFEEVGATISEAEVESILLGYCSDVDTKHLKLNLGTALFYLRRQAH